MSVVLGLVVLAVLIGIVSYKGFTVSRDAKSDGQDFPDELSDR